ARRREGGDGAEEHQGAGVEGAEGNAAAVAAGSAESRHAQARAQTGAKTGAGKSRREAGREAGREKGRKARWRHATGSLGESGMKPASAEEEYFAKEEAERLKRQAVEKSREMQASERDALKALHFMHCPKCGFNLQTIAFKGVSIDRCFHCGGTWLDAG